MWQALVTTLKVLTILALSLSASFILVDGKPEYYTFMFACLTYGLSQLIEELRQ